MSVFDETIFYRGACETLVGMLSVKLFDQQMVNPPLFD